MLKIVQAIVPAYRAGKLGLLLRLSLQAGVARVAVVLTQLARLLRAAIVLAIAAVKLGLHALASVFKSRP